MNHTRERFLNMCLPTPVSGPGGRPCGAALGGGAQIPSVHRAAQATLCPSYGLCYCVGGQPEPVVIRVQIPQRDDATGSVTEDPPDGRHVRPGGRKEGGCGVPQRVPPSPRDPGPVAEAVEALVEG